MKLKFYGAAGMVTGSCHLIQVANKKIFVDCGMFQGEDLVEGDIFTKVKDLNWNDWDFDPSELDYVLLTHAHIDHSGRLPRLVKFGFSGKIICTNPTYKLTEILLDDSARIQEGEVKNGYLTEPLYDANDVEKTKKLFRTYEYHEEIDLGNGISTKLYNSGHILGASIIDVFYKENDTPKKITFTGDIGHPGQVLMKDHEDVTESDFLVVEGTYGNREHVPREKAVSQMIEIIQHAKNESKLVIIPTFAVERLQELLYDLNDAYETKKISDFPTYIDSPMGMRVLDVYKKSTKYFDQIAKEYMKKDDDIFRFSDLEVIYKQQKFLEKKGSNIQKGVILSSSGMCTGGRIMTHLKNNLSNSNAVILFVGYQGVGTLGREIQENSGEVEN